MKRRSSIWVVATEDGWAVRREGGKRALKVLAKKEEAVAFGRKQAKKDKTELIVQAKDGSIQSKDSYGKESPAADREH